VRRAAATALVLAVTVALVHGQFQGFRGGGRTRIPPRMATARSFDGKFNFCRLMYQQVRREAGGQGWATDYPDAELNFSIRLSELTKTRISRQTDGAANHLVVRATDDELFQCPFLHIEDAGTAAFSDEEVARLRDYLLKGGFLWSDDFWGTDALEAFEAELARILPAIDYPIFDIKPDHPIFRAQFPLARIPQIPSIMHWRGSGGGTSERGSDSDHVDFRGIADRAGRLMVVMTHNTDISDAWEREADDPRFFYQFSPDGYAVGINVVLHALTH
jgi:hypothetical protein